MKTLDLDNLQQIAQAYVYAHYYRPDGLNREYDSHIAEEAFNINRIMKTLSFALIDIMDIQFKYLPTEDYRLITTLRITSCSEETLSNILDALDLTNGESRPFFKTTSTPDHDYFDITITELF